MLGTNINFSRGRGEDRFYNPPQARRLLHTAENERIRRAHSDVTPSRSVIREKSMDSVEKEKKRVGSEESKKVVAVTSCETEVKRLSNLERFLKSVTPSVHAQHLSKRNSRSFRTCSEEVPPYFVLGDLWESFREWSAYGAGVPLVLNDKDSVVQYYVPYLSGIQIYAQTVKPPVKARQLGDDSDSDFRDSSSDGSSDCEPARGYREQRNLPHLSDDLSNWMGRLSVRNQHTLLQDGFSSDDGESINSQGYLLFEYFERDTPYGREPLADKMMDLAFRFPQLLTLRSCDILSSSWISVAWYPIYRIPMGQTLKDLDACFLTYHSLSTPLGGLQRVQPPVPSHPTEMDGVPKISLPVFGLASYKFKGPLWTPSGGYERQLSNSLLQNADKWLRLLQKNLTFHPSRPLTCIEESGYQCINEDVEKDDINDEIQEDDINDKIQEDDLNDKIQEDDVDDEFQEDDIDLDDEFQEEDIDGEFQEDDVDEEFMEDDISNEFQEDDLDALLLEDKLE